MNLVGPLRKLASQYSHPIRYSLVVGNEQLALNELLGQHLQLTYLNEIYCVQCDRKTTKSFQQGYCYPCYQKLQDCNLCIIFPERCKHPHESCPDTWEHSHCSQDHIVYLANASGLKVGITRHTQIPTRWIDQGAIQAIPLFKVKNRYESGQIEVALKKYVSDKTNWRTMLNQEIPSFDMIAAKEQLLHTAREELDLLFTHHNYESLTDNEIKLTYPFLDSPKKIKSTTFDKETTVAGRLVGIKGQYLLFEDQVINIRKHSGYKISVTID